MTSIRLGVNIDHVATVRNARGIDHPDTLRAAALVEQAGADGLTVHLREDRRHIRDDDVSRLMKTLTIPLNLEMAATGEMLEIAVSHRPHACCLVPEKREELTTEGGLDVASRIEELKPSVARLNDAGIRTSMFIDPDERQVAAAEAVGAPVVELHTGAFVEAAEADRAAELGRIENAAAAAEKLGIECHAGHGLNYETVGAVARIPQIKELNIGHFLIGEAIFIGLKAAIQKMRRLMDAARSEL